MSDIDKVVFLRKLLGIATPEDRDLYTRNYTALNGIEYYPSLIRLYKYYAEILALDLRAYSLLYEVADAQNL
jgi:hypothetical protein